jgi:hypothetical protein
MLTTQPVGKHVWIATTKERCCAHREDCDGTGGSGSSSLSKVRRIAGASIRLFGSTAGPGGGPHRRGEAEVLLGALPFE